MASAVPEVQYFLHRSHSRRDYARLTTLPLCDFASTIYNAPGAPYRSFSFGRTSRKIARAGVYQDLGVCPVAELVGLMVSPLRRWAVVSPPWAVQSSTTGRPCRVACRPARRSSIPTRSLENGFGPPAFSHFLGASGRSADVEISSSFLSTADGILMKTANAVSVSLSVAGRGHPPPPHAPAAARLAAPSRRRLIASCEICHFLAVAVGFDQWTGQPPAPRGAPLRHAPSELSKRPEYSVGICVDCDDRCWTPEGALF